MLKKNMAIFGLTLVLFCIVSLESTVFAATFCVSDATGLQEALTISATNGEDDVVQIEQGTYVGNFVYASTEPNGLTIEGGYTSDCASRVEDSANTLLDGDTLGNVLALSAPNLPVEFLVEGITLQNGSVPSNGSGLYVKTGEDGNITLTNNMITGNKSTSQYGYGGGVYASAPNGTVTLTNNTITENHINFKGGGVCASGSTVTLMNNTITENSSGDEGGGVYAEAPYNSTITLINNTITGNSASYRGGGVATFNGIVTLMNNTITGNSARQYEGGGVYAREAKTVSLINNTITGNSAGLYGGGVYTYQGTVTLTNNTIIANFSQRSGGGVYTYQGTVTLINNTITENSVLYRGGGIYIVLLGNSAADIFNNIIWNNTADQQVNDLYIENDGDGDFLPATVELHNNDFDQSVSGLYIHRPFAIDSSNLNNADPIFKDFDNDDHNLSLGSPCIDYGNNNAPGLPATDKDGNNRVMDGIVDMGAYEYPGVVSLMGIIGVITDSVTLNPISGATVYCSEGSATTNALGEYSISTIPPGTYSLTASVALYHPNTTENVIVVVGSETEVNMSLNPKSTNPEDIDDDGDGYTENQSDCNDSDASIHPGAIEICGDGIDQDCNGSDLACVPGPNDTDDDGDGYTENQDDCNDNDASIHPGAIEICGDGIDQDCNGSDLACVPGPIAPIANAGADQTVNSDDTITLDGSGSKDSDGTIASYLWVQTGESIVTLSQNNIMKPTFLAPSVSEATTLTFQLTVEDNGGLTSADTVDITVNKASSGGGGGGGGCFIGAME